MDIDGVRVRVVELTGDPGDVVLMHPWTIHAGSRNIADEPRFMVTGSAVRSAAKAGPEVS